MANRIITSRELAEQMMEDARKQVDAMPLGTVEQLVNAERRPAMGIGGAIGVCLILAAQERLNRSTE